MYLIHETNLESLELILKQNKLKAACLTNCLNAGHGIYPAKKQKFVFFSVIDKLDSKYNEQLQGNVTLFFNYKLLWNRTYYISNHWTDIPDELKTNNNKQKYNQYYKSTKKVLTKLFKDSLDMLDGKAFNVFQQVAILKHCDLKYLEKIKFHNCKPSDKIIKLLKKKYPHIILEVTEKKPPPQPFFTKLYNFFKK
tara:strand:+ start:142 stop:726 length:585 start_codon:yes stop_codon:yes gene_type:complete